MLAYNWRSSQGIGWQAPSIIMEWPDRLMGQSHFRNITRTIPCACLNQRHKFCGASIILVLAKLPVEERMPMGVMRVYVQQMEQDAMFFIQLTVRMVMMAIRCFGIMSVLANMAMVDVRNNTVHQHAKHEEQERKGFYPSGKIHPSAS